MKRGPTLQCTPALHYSADLCFQTYTEPVTLKYGKLATNYRRIYGYYYTVVSLSINSIQQLENLSSAVDIPIDMHTHAGSAFDKLITA